MARYLFGLIAALTLSAVACAEPLPWSYSVRFNAPSGFNGIGLGTETQPNYDPVSGETTGTPYQILLPTDPGNSGRVRTHYQTDLGTTSLFSFGYGDWVLAPVVPPGVPYVDRKFAISWGFQGTEIATGTAIGTISASGVFTSGSGNFWIGLDHEEIITLGGERARVRFQGVNGEESSRIDMTVTRLDAVQTPEPATLVLAGIGLAGMIAVRRRRAGARL